MSKICMSKLNFYLSRQSDTGFGAPGEGAYNTFPSRKIVFTIVVKETEGYYSQRIQPAMHYMTTAR